MITVAVRENSIAVMGHADRPDGVPPGQNIICAAVSAITTMLIDGLENIAEADVKARQVSGMTEIGWQHLNEIGKALIDAWFLGICGIERSYGQIRII